MMRTPAATPVTRSDDCVPLPVPGRAQSVLELIGSELLDLEELHPRAYLLLATLCAAAGYACLLLFPALVLAGISGLHESLHWNQTVVWNSVLLWSAVLMVSALVSYRIFRFQPAPPGGNVLDREKAPSLFELLATLSGHYRRIGIDRVVLTSGFELRIVKTPLCGLPVWSTTTLVIGRPLIQYLSPSRFKCALARRLGQFSKRYNRLGNWLYQLREIWPQYCSREQPPGFGFQPVMWIFRVYAPLYRLVSLPAARLDELAADNYAMELFSDAEVLDTITTEMVCRTYLAEKYWPVIRTIAASERQAMAGFHAGMAALLRTGLQDGKTTGWVAKTLSADSRWDDPIPSLARRVENIGHLDASMDSMDGESAAAAYLGAVPDKRHGTRGSGADRETVQVARLRERWLRIRKLVLQVSDRLKKGTGTRRRFRASSPHT
jgi:hypothetical protein